MKYIYNVTFHIEQEVFPQWQSWIEQHFDRLLKESEFLQIRLLQIHTEHVQSKVFSVQYEADTKQAITHFQSALEEKYRRELFLQFGEKVLTFATLLTVEKEVKK